MFKYMLLENILHYSKETFLLQINKFKIAQV